jgi:hypothetical protein
VVGLNQFSSIIRLSLSELELKIFHTLNFVARAVYTYMCMYVLLASVRDMAEASVGQATAGETSCASSCEENKCTSVNEVL